MPGLTYSQSLPGTLPDRDSAAARANHHHSAAHHPFLAATLTSAQFANSPSQQLEDQQRLKVEDALGYLDQVKIQFGAHPQVYNDFLDIMKDFKSQAIDTPGVIQRVSRLFRGNPNLIVGFNTFLPPGYRIELLEGNGDRVAIRDPSGKTLVISNEPDSLSLSGRHSLPPPSTIQMDRGSSTSADILKPHGQSQASSMPAAVSRTQSPSVQRPQPLSQPQSAFPVDPEIAQRMTQQPLEFNHAISYVNKIKLRFHDQPEVYKQFLEILHAYQKQQKLLKEGGLPPNEMQISEGEVYDQVARLFATEADLLNEFSQFLPDTTPPPNFPTQRKLARPASSAGRSASPNRSTPSASPHPPVSRTPSSPVPAAAPPAKRNIKAAERDIPPEVPGKKARPMHQIRYDVSYAEAAKYGTLSEYQFFDKVREALKMREIYENFLRCLVLFNKELISRAELLQILTPFLGKFPELLKWMKDFLGVSDSCGFSESVPRAALRIGISSELAMEIDYASCRQLGASYRALPDWYKKNKQPTCSGRTQLCEGVLNDTWVSFPSWSSEDTTSVSLKKTQYEEYIYRTEDERFELDIVIETNMATIQVLEAVLLRMAKMTVEEKARFRLEDNLGGRSDVLQLRAVKRIYGDKSPDVIEGMKRNPAVAVPLVLRRLKAKDEEWREAQRSFNRVWREQNEKFYLKSLDHQALNFKQNDLRQLKSKVLLNQIETLYDERHEHVEHIGGPHLSINYPSDRLVFYDSIDLIIHHVKRQAGIQQDEKSHIKKLLKHTLPDVFGLDRADLSDDEDDAQDDDDRSSVTSSNNSVHSVSKRQQKQRSQQTREERSKRLKRAVGTTSVAVESNDISNYSAGTNQSAAVSVPASKPAMTTCGYTLMLFPNAWYVFLRLHCLLCGRLADFRRYALEYANNERLNSQRVGASSSAAEILKYRPKASVAYNDLYAAMLDQIRNLLDGQVDATQYEDTLRDMFTIRAYAAFTMDKVIQTIVRQLQLMISEEICVESLRLYEEWRSRGGAGGLAIEGTDRLALQESYQRAMEQLLTDQNCFKCFIYCQWDDDVRVTFELLDTDSYEGDEEDNDVEESMTMTKTKAGAAAVVKREQEWSEFVETFANADLKPPPEAHFLFDPPRPVATRSKPFYLPRNMTRVRKQLLAFKSLESATISVTTLATDGVESANEEALVEDKLGVPASVEVDDGQKPSTSEPRSTISVSGTVITTGTEDSTMLALACRNVTIQDDEQVQFSKPKYRFAFTDRSQMFLYRKGMLRKAHETHRVVTQARYKRYAEMLHRWRLEHVSAEDARRCLDWMKGGAVAESPPIAPVTVKEVPASDRHVPYRTYNLYCLAQRSNLVGGELR